MSLALASRLNAVLRNGRHPEDSRSLERVEGSCADNGAPSQASAFLVGKKLSLMSGPRRMTPRRPAHL